MYNWKLIVQRILCTILCELRNGLMVEPLQKMLKRSIICIYLNYRIYREYYSSKQKIILWVQLGIKKKTFGLLAVINVLLSILK